MDHYHFYILHKLYRDMEQDVHLQGIMFILKILKIVPTLPRLVSPPTYSMSQNITQVTIP